LPSPATTSTSTLSLHDALPISRAALLARRHEDRLLLRPRLQWELRHLGRRCSDRRADAVDEHRRGDDAANAGLGRRIRADLVARDRKSTRLNSSHRTISYAVFC